MSIQEYAVFKRDLEADAREDGFELTMPATAADFERGGIIGSVFQISVPAASRW